VTRKFKTLGRQKTDIKEQLKQQLLTKRSNTAQRKSKGFDVQETWLQSCHLHLGTVNFNKKLSEPFPSFAK
jgi:hypothetical protein